MQAKNAFGLVKYSPNDVFSDPVVSKTIHKLLGIWFKLLEIEGKDAEELRKHTIESCERSTKHSEDLEKELIDHYERLKVIDTMNKKLAGRAGQIFSYAKQYLPPPSPAFTILDIGAGTGTIAKKFYDEGYNIRMHDVVGDGEEKRVPEVVDLENAARPLPYDLHGNHEPLRYADNSFDASLLSCVLHHCDTPFKVLQEAVRVTKPGGRIYILESVYGVSREQITDAAYARNQEMHDLFFNLNAEQQKKYGTFLDWFLNKVSFRNNAFVPCNFNSPENWDKIFAEHGLNIVAKNIVGIDQPVTPEFHLFYVVEKKKN